jgi:two-component system, NarL family, response regulator LiaR
MKDDMPSKSLLESIVSELPPLQILIVEDDPLIQLGLEQYFQELTQFKIIGQETDGYLGVEAALKLKPDITIMDIGLPQLDGIAATQQIKQASPELRIVMLTSHNTKTEMMAALASGADAYCIKGTSMIGLLAAIATAQEGGIYLDPQIARQAVKNLKPLNTSNNLGQLSTRELEILQLIVAGHSNPEIAKRLYLSLSTIKTHVHSIMNKLAVSDRVQAAVVALRSGLVE